MFCFNIFFVLMMKHFVNDNRRTICLRYAITTDSVNKLHFHQSFISPHLFLNNKTLQVSEIFSQMQIFSGSP